jgi:hypothetical protein
VQDWPRFKNEWRFPLKNLAHVLAIALVSSAVPLASMNLFAQSFNYTGDLQHDRAWHTSTLIKSGTCAGKVLITGGLNDDKDTINVAELYNPSTGSFVYTSGKMQHDRAYHTATLLADGQTVLIAGGRDDDGTTINSAETFICSSSGNGTFSAVGNMLTARQFQTATLLPGTSGAVLIAGGQTGTKNGSTNTLQSLSSAELYMPASHSFVATGALVHDRAYHTATLITGGTYINKVLIAAGLDNDKTTINVAEIYDPSSGKFTAAPNMVHDRAYHTATLLSDGETVLITGGRNADGTTINSAEVFNSSGVFVAVGNLVHDRQFHTATLLGDGTVLIAAGQSGTSNGNGNSLQTLSSAELFHPGSGSSGTFTTTGSLRHDRVNHTATMLNTGHVLISAGLNDDGDTLNLAELY